MNICLKPGTGTHRGLVEKMNNTDTRKLLSSVLRSNKETIAHKINDLFFSLAFENEHTIDSRRLLELPPEELEFFHAFTVNQNSNRVIQLGQSRAAEGLNIKSILGINSVLVRFYLENADVIRQNLIQPALTSVADYIAAYVQGYSTESVNKTMRQQQDIRQALSSALAGQRNELFVRNHALSSSINAILLADLEGNVTYVNPSFVSMWRYSNKDEVLQLRHIDQITSLEVGKIFRSLEATTKWRGELQLKRADSTKLEIEMAASQLSMTKRTYSAQWHLS